MPAHGGEFQPGMSHSSAPCAEAFRDAVACHRHGGTALLPPVPHSLMESEQCKAQQGLTCLPVRRVARGRFF